MRNEKAADNHRAELFIAERLESRTMLTTGAVDPTFGSDGVASVGQFTNPTHMVIEQNGTLVVSTDQGVVGVNQNGSLDTSFGSDGVVNPDFVPVDVRLDPDGDIVVAGTVNNNIEVARYTPSGALDSTFGSGGIVTITAPTNYTYQVGEFVVQNDGKIVVGASQTSTVLGVAEPGWLQLTLVRLNTNGLVDATYGTNGYVYGYELSAPETMNLLPNGSVVVTAVINPIGQERNSGAYVVGPTGLKLYLVGSASTYSDAITDSTGRFLLASNPDTFDYNFYVQRYLEDGKADNTFGLTPGFGAPPFDLGGYFFNYNYDNFEGMAAEPDGGVLLVYSGGAALPSGLNAPTVDAQYTFVALNSSGGFDSSFGFGGMALSPGSATAFSATTNPIILSDGDFLIAGTDANGKLAIAKFQGSDDVPTSPSVSSVNFAPPAIGKKWAYITVTFAKGSADLNLSTLDVPSSVLVEDGAANNVSAIELGAAGLVSNSGGDGLPVTATYAFLLAPRGLNRGERGVYTFIVGSNAIKDTAGVGNVGAVASFSIYIPRHNRGAPVVTEVMPPPTMDTAVAPGADDLLLKDGQSPLS
jgi:uncharacterized delta-60 repeat protein